MGRARLRPGPLVVTFTIEWLIMEKRASGNYQFALSGLQPPSNLYVQASQGLRLTVWNSLAAVDVTLFFRILRPNGTVEPGFIPMTGIPTDRTPKSQAVPTGEGFLLSAIATVNPPALPVRGQTFVRVELTQNPDPTAIPLQVLCADYVTAETPVGFPGTPVRSSLEGPGALVSHAIPDPLIGNVATFTVPIGLRWRPLMVEGQLACDATAGPRTVTLTFDNGSVGIWQSAIVNFIWDANDVNFYIFQTQRYPEQPVSGQPAGEIGDGLALLQFFNVTIAVDPFLHAGDDLASAVIYVEEWIII